MNKRQRKKFEKKLRHKTYNGYRAAFIVKRLFESAHRDGIDTSGGNNLVYIVTDRTGNLKRPKKCQLFTNVIPVSSKFHSEEEREIDMSFNCRPIEPDEEIIKVASFTDLWNTFGMPQKPPKDEINIE